jgi:hypothetical protein
MRKSMDLLVNDGGPFTGTVFVDGYRIGDRELEGVDFSAEVKAGILDMDSIQVFPDCKRYFEGIVGRSEWMQTVREAFSDWDEFDVVGGDVTWRESSRPSLRPIKIKKMSFHDIINHPNLSLSPRDYITDEEE